MAMFGGKTPSAGDVKSMVAAHSKVPPKLQPHYRKKVIGHARKAGAMQHIPPPWLKGGAGGGDSAGDSGGDSGSSSGKPNPFAGKKAPPFGKKKAPPFGGK